MKKSLIILPSLLLCSCSVSNKPIVKVTYLVNNEPVFVRVINKGDPIGISYIYDFPSHQTHASKWLDASGQEYTKESIIDKSISLNGVIRTNLQIVNNEEEEFVRIKGTYHVHEDGKLVIQENYYSKRVMIDENALTNNNDVKSIYLPKDLYHLSSGNFTNCPKLTSINYAGTMEDFDNLSKDTFTLPSGVHMVYNTSFEI